MAKENLQIIQFDNDDHYFTVVDLILSTWNMDLVGKASNKEESINLVEQITRGKIKPDVAIIEAFMGKSFEDGSKIAERLRELNPKIKIIGYSTEDTSDWADISAIKDLKDQAQSVVEALCKVTGNTYKLANVVHEGLN